MRNSGNGGSRRLKPRRKRVYCFRKPSEIQAELDRERLKQERAAAKRKKLG